jgi:electron transport complex protein RnfC
MADVAHFIEIPAPDVVWVLGPSADSPMPSARRGRVEAGTSLFDGFGTTPTAGEAGPPVVRHDTAGRRRWAVPIAADEDATSTAGDRVRSGVVGIADLITRLDQAGMSADRHGSPSLRDQLRRAGERSSDVVVCHFLEADPSLPLQIEWALSRPRQVRDGLLGLRRTLGAKRVLLAVAPRHLRRLERALRDPDSAIAPLPSSEAGSPDASRDVEPLQPAEVQGLRLVPLANAYPQSDPSLLATTLLKRRLTPGALPASVGMFLLDAVAAAGVGAVLRGGDPIATVPLAVRDHRRDISVLAEVARGTRVCDALLYLGMLHRDPERAVLDEADRPVPPLRAGDFLRGRRVDPGAVIDGGELLVHVLNDDPSPRPDPCIRCGWCLDICPTGVHAAGLLDCVEAGDARLAARFGAAACIGCGLCEFVCPSRLPLTQVAVTARDGLSAHRRQADATGPRDR